MNMLSLGANKFLSFIARSCPLFSLRLIHLKSAQTVEFFKAEGMRQNDNEQFERVFDLLLLLQRFSPKNIVEMGTGLSTVVFAQYAQKNNAQLFSAEQNPEWLELTSRALKNAGLSHKPVLAAVEINDKECRYLYDMDPNVDFIYVDGPANLTEGRHVPCVDVVKAFDNNITPKVIVVDGRISSLDAMLNHPTGKLYKWYFSRTYVHKTKKNLPFRVGRHSVGVLIENS